MIDDDDNKLLYPDVLIFSLTLNARPGMYKIEELYFLFWLLKNSNGETYLKKSSSHQSKP